MSKNIMSNKERIELMESPGNAKDARRVRKEERRRREQRKRDNLKRIALEKKKKKRVISEEIRERRLNEKRRNVFSQVSSGYRLDGDILLSDSFLTKNIVNPEHRDNE